MFNQNDVITRDGGLFRVLFTNSEHAALYELSGKGSAASISYSLVPIDTLKNEEDRGLAVPADDPYSELKYISDNDIRMKKAKENYKLIADVVSDPDVLYTPALRTRKLKELAGDNNQLRHLYRLIARWFQRGQSMCALASDYRSVGKKKNFTVSPGRKSRTGTERPLCTDEFKKLMDGVIKKYVLKENGLSLRRAYAKLLNAYQEKHPDSKELPTEGQLSSYYYRTYNRRQRNQKRNSSIIYNKDIKAKMGSVYETVSAAGEVYEIDSTPDNVYLVSSVDRSQCIGRPVLYSVTDRFTGMIVGIYVSLENAQYRSAAEALFCAISDKRKYFKENFNIDFDWNWNAKGIPAAVCADNAELEGSRIEVFARSHNVALINSAPYRADQKGSVESSIFLIQQELKQYLKTSAPDVLTLKKAGAQDRRTDGFLDLNEYRTLVLRAVNTVNNRLRTKFPKGYLVKEFKSPDRFWDWAVATGNSDLQTPHDLTKLRVSLLAQEKATVSREGIKCRSIRYTCPELERDGWFDTDKDSKRPYDPVVVIDNGNAGNAWVFPDPGKKPNVFYACRLKSEHEFLKGCCLYEAEQILKQLSEAGKRTTDQQNKIRAEMDKQVTDIVNEARARTAAAQSSLSRKEKLAQTKTSRQMEQNLDSRARAMDNQGSKVPDQSASTVQQSAAPDDHWDLLDPFSTAFAEKKDR